MLIHQHQQGVYQLLIGLRLEHVAILALVIGGAVALHTAVAALQQGAACQRQGHGEGQQKGGDTAFHEGGLLFGGVGVGLGSLV